MSPVLLDQEKFRFIQCSFVHVPYRIHCEQGDERVEIECKNRVEWEKAHGRQRSCLLADAPIKRDTAGVCSGVTLQIWTYVGTCDIGNYWVAAFGLDFIVFCFRIAARDFDNLRELKRDAKRGKRGGNERADPQEIEKIGSNSVRYGKRSVKQGLSYSRYQSKITTRPRPRPLQDRCRICNDDDDSIPFCSMQIAVKPNSTYWVKSLQLGARRREDGIGRHGSTIETNRLLECLGWKGQSFYE